MGSINKNWLLIIILFGVILTIFISYVMKKNMNSNTEFIPIKFKNVGNAKQVILVTTDSIGEHGATIRTFEKVTDGWKEIYSMTGSIGKNGFSYEKMEGDLKTPIGMYTITKTFGREENPGNKMPYQKITANDIWVDDPKSSLYNTWQTKQNAEGKYSSAEEMNIPQYDYGFIIDYNTGRIPNKGSAIFFHVLGESGYTAGCTATSKDNVIKILKWLDLEKNPLIIQVPVDKLDDY